jgi:hypothetical protein
MLKNYNPKLPYLSAFRQQMAALVNAGGGRVLVNKFGHHETSIRSSLACTLVPVPLLWANRSITMPRRSWCIVVRLWVGLALASSSVRCLMRWCSGPGVLHEVRLVEMLLGMPQSTCKLAPCSADERSIRLHSQSLNL